jgi:hypothetical protein
MTDSDLASMRMRLIPPVSAMIAAAEPGVWSWFAMIGVSGLRHQVLRHAGLMRYDCREPSKMAAEFQTPPWCNLVATMERFDGLDYFGRSLVVFQLAQLSYCDAVFRLAGLVVPNGDPAHDRYAYEVARVHGSVPGHGKQALEVWEELATNSADKVLGLAACSQGIGHSIRNGLGPSVASRFAEHSDRILASGIPDDWHACLMRSRLHRALALLRMAERQPERMREELKMGAHFSDQLFAGLPEGTDRMVAAENKRILTESRIRAAGHAHGYETSDQIRSFCQDLLQLDPYCVQTRIAVGDGHVAIGDYGTAAHWYSRAGELGTGAGAMAWFRAAQCYEAIGDRASAINAAGRCLELDRTAIEPRSYLSHCADDGDKAAIERHRLYA